MVDAALYQQFGIYLAGKNNVLREMTENDLKQEVKSFLIDKYPGAKRPPHKLIQMLASPVIDPDAKFESLAIFNNEDKNSCLSPFENASTPSSNLSDSSCPEGFILTEFSRHCIHKGERKMSFDSGSTYCQNVSTGAAHILDLEDMLLAVDINTFINNGM